MTRSRVKKASFCSFPSVSPFSALSLLSIAASHVSSSHFILFSCLVFQPSAGPDLLCFNITHGVSQAVLPRPPQHAVPAVVEAVSSGELVPGAPGISSLSPDHCQEGELPQVHLRNTNSFQSNTHTPEHQHSC